MLLLNHSLSHYQAKRNYALLGLEVGLLHNAEQQEEEVIEKLEAEEMDKDEEAGEVGGTRAAALP
jgi:hypothetical protein